jgi:hypothetical protein
MICAVVMLRIGYCKIWGSVVVVLEVQMFWDIMLFWLCVVPDVVKEFSAFMLG